MQSINQKRAKGKKILQLKEIKNCTRIQLRCIQFMRETVFFLCYIIASNINNNNYNYGVFVCFLSQLLQSRLTQR